MSSMPAALRNALIAVAGLVIFGIGSFALVRAVRSGEVLPGVTIAGSEISLGGLTPEEVERAAHDHETVLATTPISVRINGADVDLVPQNVGLDIDEAELADQAMGVGRDGGVPQQFRWWLGHLFSGVEVTPTTDIDDEALEMVLSAWDTEHVGEPAFLGGVAVEGLTPIPRYPHAGQEIDRGSARELLIQAVLDPADDPAVLTIGTQYPTLSEEDVDRAVEQAQLLLSGPVTLAAADEDVSVVFSTVDLARALVSTTDPSGIILSFDPSEVERVLATNRTSIELPPVDARWEIGETEVTIVPGRKGTLIDPETTAERLAIAASSSSRRGVLPFVEGADPEVTTEDLEALGVRHLVASFTTYHPCCQNRVTNIHLIADAVDGVYLEPGAEFDLNQHVGERTREKGFLEDGTIEGGEIIKTVGGGVSQFATTLYNAVFWGGYEDITHKPHSFYFSRYPEGIEATISWPLPDLKFRNDSDHGVVIKTEYTDTSITVKLYGDNDGRIVTGSHRQTTTIEVVEEGGATARRITANVSGRFGFTEPPTEYRAAEDLDVEEQRTVQSPRQGWSVTVTRVIEQNGVETTQEWRVRYAPQREIIEVHPCMLPDAEEGSCPTTTTTTEAETTTTIEE